MGVQQHTVLFRVEIDGEPLPDDVAAMLVSAIVDDTLLQPDLVALTFRDPERIVVEKSGVQFGSVLVVTVVSPAEPGGVELIRGEVTAIEADIGPGGTLTILRGFDHSHRLFRGRVTETYRNMTLSDIAGRVARRAGLQPGTIDATSVVYDHVSQHNLTDWEFLQRLGREIGYLVGVVDGALDFRPMPAAAGAPDVEGLEGEDPLQLVLGANLLRLRAVVTSAEQVSEVRVRAWDSGQKQALVGRAPAGTAGVSLSVTPSELADTFGSPSYVAVDSPYATQDEVDAAAAALAEQIAGAFAELEGAVRGNPALRAGVPVSLGLVGPPFDGKYTVTASRHVYDSIEGYTTRFTVSGRQDRSLLGLAAGGRGLGGRVAGVVPATVTNVNDPDGLGRVKLALPWLSEDYETDWVRVVQSGAGPSRGALVLPEVGDEVLAAFEQGDLRRPFVIGGLFNGVDPPSLDGDFIDSATGMVSRRGVTSKNGHRLVFADSDAADGVMVATAGDSLVVHLDHADTKLTISSDGTVEISGARGLRMESGDMLELKGRRMSISADLELELKAQSIKLN